MSWFDEFLSIINHLQTPAEVYDAIVNVLASAPGPLTLDEIMVRARSSELQLGTALTTALNAIDANQALRETFRVELVKLWTEGKIRIDSDNGVYRITLRTRQV